MERGAYCHFCGTQLALEFSDPLGGCYGCPSCPPSTHWRWNEDTEFLQLYVVGDQCPYCDLKITESGLKLRPQKKRVHADADAVKAQPVASEVQPTQVQPREVQPGIDSVVIKPQNGKKPGKPVTVDEVWWASVVEWCRANNGHDVRNHHNCSKELARMQSKGEFPVVWHNRDHIPGTRELVASGTA